MTLLILKTGAVIIAMSLWIASITGCIIQLRTGNFIHFSFTLFLMGLASAMLAMTLSVLRSTKSPTSKRKCTSDGYRDDTAAISIKFKNGSTIEMKEYDGAK